jgi:hypothetical protein
MPERQVELGSHTGMLALFGHPIRHSLSPRIHNAALQVHGLDLVYLAFDVRPEELPAAISGIRALGIRGANLTVPHKEAALALLDEVDPLAARVGAVNTVVNGDGQLMGYNTDIFGFSAALRTVMPEGAKGRDCLVIGAGGAARAVVAALVEDGAATVYVNNRSYEHRCRILGCDQMPSIARRGIARGGILSRFDRQRHPIGVGGFGQALAASCRYCSQRTRGGRPGLRTWSYRTGASFTLKGGRRRGR